MDEQAADNSVIIGLVMRMKTRLDALERDAAFIEKRIFDIELRRDIRNEELSSSLKSVHSTTLGMKSQLKDDNKMITLLAQDMRSSVKKEQLSAIAGQIDDLPIEQYVTPDDLKRGI